MQTERQTKSRTDPDLRIGLSLAALAALGIAFCFLVLASYGLSPVERLDLRILQGFIAHRGNGFPASDLAFSADPAPLVAMLGIVVVAGLALGRREQVVAAVVLVAGANVTTQLLKVLLAHPRVQPYSGADIGPAALPSGHTTASASLAAAALLVSPVRLRPLVALAGLAYALAVAASILMLHWHLPSDVLGGWMVVVGWVLLAGVGLSSAELRARRNSRAKTGWQESRDWRPGQGPSPSGSA